MAIGICKCGRRTVKHDNCAYTFKWLCEECRQRIREEVNLSNLHPSLKELFNSVLKRSA